LDAPRCGYRKGGERVALTPDDARTHTLAARLLLPLAGLILVFAVWSGVYWILRPPAYVLPAPLDILGRVVDARELLLESSGMTARVALIALAVSSALGIPLGIAVARWRLIRATVMPPIVAIQSVPKIALAPLMVAWFGFGTLPQVVVAVLVTFFPLMLAAIVGVDTIPRNTIFVARSMGYRGPRLLRYIVLPAIAPHVAAAFRMSATLALVGAIVAEFVGSSGGLGNAMMVAMGVRDMELVFAALIATALLGVLLYSAASVITWGLTRGMNPEFMRSSA
jgi:NitT/TauT family transport system permease protein